LRKNWPNKAKGQAGLIFKKTRKQVQGDSKKGVLKRVRDDPVKRKEAETTLGCQEKNETGEESKMRQSGFFSHLICNFLTEIVKFN